MPRLAKLMGNDHPLFSYNISQLEKSIGDDTIDVAILADIADFSQSAMRRLGLDPSDTSARELYMALNNFCKKGNVERLLHACHYSLVCIDGHLVSLNPYDVSENYHHGLSFENRKVFQAQTRLKAEVVRRYARHEKTHTPLVYELTHEVGVDDELSNKRKQDMNDAPSMLAIGDIFSDAFIKLNEDYARVEKDQNGEVRLSLPFGSKPPYDDVDVVHAVGPSPNAGVSCARLGLDVGVRAWIGGDKVGCDVVEYLNEQKIATDMMSVDKDAKTNYYYVLRYGADRTILVKNEDYDYSWQDPETAPDWVYLSLISKKSWQLHEDLLEYLHRNPETKLAFQPGTFHFEWGAEKLAGIYQKSHIIIMNREEAMDVTGLGYDSIKKLANGLHALGPKIVVITDGPHGSYASYDNRVVTIPNYPDPAPPLDRTGAGDAFASTIVAALAMGYNMDTALTWAPINSMSVVQKLGAQAGLLSKEKIEYYLKNAPEWYKVQEHTEE